MFIRRQPTSIRITPEDIIEFDESERSNKQNDIDQPFAASSYSTDQQYRDDASLKNHLPNVSSTEIGDESSLMYDTIDERHLEQQQKKSDSNGGVTSYEGSNVTSNSRNISIERGNHTINATTNPNTSFNSSVDVMDISHNSSADGNWTMKERERNYRVGVLPR